MFVTDTHKDRYRSKIWILDTGLFSEALLYYSLRILLYCVYCTLISSSDLHM